jgi:chromosome segregation ATPase
MVIDLDWFTLFWIVLFGLGGLLFLKNHWYNSGYSIGNRIGKKSGAIELEPLKESLSEKDGTIDHLKSNIKELEVQLSDKAKELELAEASKQEEIVKVIEAGRTELVELAGLAETKARLEANVEGLKAKLAALESKKEEPTTEVPGPERTEQGQIISSKRTAKVEILEALEDTRLTFKELVVKTGRAKSTLNEALKRLVRDGIVGIDPNTKEYCLVNRTRQTEPND